MSAHLQGLLALYEEAPFREAWAGEIAAVRTMRKTVHAGVDERTAPTFNVSARGIDLKLRDQFPREESITEGENGNSQGSVERTVLG